MAFSRNPPFHKSVTQYATHECVVRGVNSGRGKFKNVWQRDEAAEPFFSFLPSRCAAPDPSVPEGCQHWGRRRGTFVRAGELMEPFTPFANMFVFVLKEAVHGRKLSSLFWRDVNPISQTVERKQTCLRNTVNRQWQCKNKQKWVLDHKVGEKTMHFYWSTDYFSWQLWLTPPS